MPVKRTQARLYLNLSSHCHSNLKHSLVAPSFHVSDSGIRITLATHCPGPGQPGENSASSYRREDALDDCMVIVFEYHLKPVKSLVRGGSQLVTSPDFSLELTRSFLGST